MCSKSELQIILTEIAKTAKETFGEQLDSVILYARNCGSTDRQ